MSMELVPYNILDPVWLRDFYPSDLPEAWRLEYYANEYRMLFIPTDWWGQLPESDEIPEFELVLVEGDEPLLQNAAWSEVQQISTKMKQPCDGSEDSLCRWIFCNQTLVVIHLVPEDGHTLRDMRREVEGIAARFPSSQVILVIEAAPDYLAQVGILLQLMQR